MVVTGELIVLGLTNGEVVIENITAPEPYLKPFPAFEDVFAEPLALHRKHFLPLVSVDASVVDPDLDCWLHFVMPVEPLLELDVGTFTAEFHDFYNREGQYAFQVVGGKYTFEGGLPVLRLRVRRDLPRVQEPGRGNLRGLPEAVFDVRGEQARLSHIRAHPLLRRVAVRPTRDSCGPLVSQLGGDPVSSHAPEPAGPVNRSGRPFRYIGEVQGFSYCDGGIQAILLFYVPEEQIALFRTEWT
jgi:hypothetical protein